MALQETKRSPNTVNRGPENSLEEVSNLLCGDLNTVHDRGNDLRLGRSSLGLVPENTDAPSKLIQATLHKANHCDHVEESTDKEQKRASNSDEGDSDQANSRAQPLPQPLHLRESSKKRDDEVEKIAEQTCDEIDSRTHALDDILNNVRQNGDQRRGRLRNLKERRGKGVQRRVHDTADCLNQLPRHSSDSLERRGNQFHAGNSISNRVLHRGEEIDKPFSDGRMGHEVAKALKKHPEGFPNQGEDSSQRRGNDAEPICYSDKTRSDGPQPLISA